MKKFAIALSLSIITFFTSFTACFAEQLAFNTHAAELGKFTCQTLLPWNEMIIANEETVDGKKTYKYTIYARPAKRRLYPVVIMATNGMGDPLYDKLSAAFKEGGDQTALNEFLNDEMAAVVQKNNVITLHGIYTTKNTRQKFIIISSEKGNESTIYASTYINGFNYSFFLPTGREYKEDELNQLKTNFFKILDTFKTTG